MGSIWEYVIIFLLAAVPWIEVAAVIPLGIIRGLSSTYVVIVAFLGNLSTIILLVYLFDKIKDFWVRKKGSKKHPGSGWRERSEFGINMVCRALVCLDRFSLVFTLRLSLV